MNKFYMLALTDEPASQHFALCRRAGVEKTPSVDSNAAVGKSSFCVSAEDYSCKADDTPELVRLLASLFGQDVHASYNFAPKSRCAPQSRRKPLFFSSFSLLVTAILSRNFGRPLLFTNMAWQPGKTKEAQFRA